MGSIKYESVQDFGILSYLVYDKYNQYFRDENPETLIKSDNSNHLLNIYIIKETVDLENGLQAMLVKNGNDFTFVFRGTEEGLGVLDCLRAVA